MPILNSARPGLRRASLRLLPLGALAVAGCAHLKEWFPSHEDVFTPIAPNVGIAHVVGKDTTWTLTGPGYDLRSRSRTLLAAAQTSLDGVVADYRGYFAADPPTVPIVVLQAPAYGSRPDTAQLHAAVASGATPLFIRTGEQQRTRYGPGQDIVVVSPVVRAWLKALAARPDSTPTPQDRVAATRWVTTAVPALVIGNPDPDMVTLQIARHPDHLLALRSVFSGDRPAPTAEESRDSAARANSWSGQGDRELGRPTGRGAFPMSRSQLVALTGTRLWDGEAISVANFLAAKEGKTFVGQAARTLLGGGSIDDVLAQARNVPRDVDAFDRAWRDWLTQQAQSDDHASR